MTEPTLQTIFLLGFAAYAARHNLPAYIHKAAWWIMHCRTAVLGGHIQACPDGHIERMHYNSCKHRVCPQCAFIQVCKWLAKQKARLLACDHYHVIFTIPHELNCLWHPNAKLMAKILFNSAWQTIHELLSDKKYLGAKVGVIASLHTWTKTLMPHPHIHCLVTGGGLWEGNWKKLRHDYLFPIAVAKILFRGKVLSAIAQALEKGQLLIPSHKTQGEIQRIIKRLWKKKWNVDIRDKYSHGQGVLTYLARYLRGGPISNSRIVKIEDGKVTFHVGREKKQLLTLPIEEFIERFIWHIPKPSLVVVRCYGLYANGRKRPLDLCHQLLGSPSISEPCKLNWQDTLESIFSKSQNHNQTQANPWQCPVCGKRLIVKATLPRQSLTRIAHAPP